MSKFINKFNKFCLVSIPSTLIAMSIYKGYKYEQLNIRFIDKFGHPVEFIHKADPETQIEAQKYLDDINSKWFGIIRCDN